MTDFLKEGNVVKGGVNETTSIVDRPPPPTPTKSKTIYPAAIREAALVDSLEKQVSDLRDTLLDQLLDNLDRADAIQQQLLGDIAEEQCHKFHRQIVDLHDAICDAMGVRVSVS